MWTTGIVRGKADYSEDAIDVKIELSGDAGEKGDHIVPVNVSMIADNPTYLEQKVFKRLRELNARTTLATITEGLTFTLPKDDPA